MTTHAELFQTFIDGETSPSRASNMRIIADGAGSRTVLVSGRDSSHPGIVIAVREPMDRVVIPQSSRRPNPGSWQEVSVMTRTARDHWGHFQSYAHRNHPEERIVSQEAIDGELQPNPNDVLTEV